MKKAGILNRHLAGAPAELGHGDGGLVCDAAELVVEGATAATEVREANPAAAERLDGRFPGLTPVPHEKLRELSAGARLVVRTGEARPYAKVLLRCGVFS